MKLLSKISGCRFTALTLCCALAAAAAGCKGLAAPGADATTASATDVAGADAGGADATSGDGLADTDAADATDAAGSSDASGDGTSDAAVAQQVLAAAAGMAVNVLDKAAVMTVQLRVTNALGMPIPGAEVVVNGKTFAVDDTAATLTGISVSASPTITVRAPGHASSAFVLDPMRALHGPAIVLTPFEGSASFAAVLGGTLKIAAATITIGDGGVVGPDGKPYLGVVNVAATATDLARDLLDPAQGISSLAAAKLPDPVVMVEAAGGATHAASLKLASAYVALTGDAGQKLQPAPGKPAQVTFKLGSALADAFPGAYSAGAKLDVASRNEATGKWSMSAKCTVQKGKEGWTCSGAVPHFSEAAVVKTQQYGCLLIDNIELSVPTDKTVTWRTQTLSAPNGLPVTGHFYSNGGKLGMCAIVPIEVHSLALKMEYELAPAGAAASPKPTFAPGTSMVAANFFVGKPSDQGLDKIANLDKSTVDGCLAACKGAPAQKAQFASKPLPPVTGEPMKLPPLAAVPQYPEVDWGSVDVDKDGSPAIADCDDNDPARSPNFGGDACGDGIDQNCDGKDTQCGVSCSQAADKCLPGCMGVDGTPSAKTIACVAACPGVEPVTTEEGNLWTKLLSCILGCPDGACVEAKCFGAYEACYASSFGTCASVAPCTLGCAPLAVAGLEAEANACLQACPLAGSGTAGQVTDLINCSAGACDGKLGSCAATAKNPVSTCKAADMGCYATIPACASANAACFNP